MNARRTHYFLRSHYSFEVERRDGQRARRKEDIALLLAATNLKLMADADAPVAQLHQQIDYLHDLVEQIMQKHRPQQEVPGAHSKDATDEQTHAA